MGGVAMNATIQAAGVIDGDEAGMLLASGVDWLGFPFGLEVHAEDLDEDAAGKIIARIPPPRRGVLITYLKSARKILALAGRIGARTVQLHGDIAVSELPTLRAHGLTLIKSLVVRGDNLQELRAAVGAFEATVDGFITDTFDAATGARGATGKTHDWRVSAALVRLSKKPVMLAGGLTPENVAAAIMAVRPSGVDAHTGLEDEHGRKAPALVAAFVRNARAAFGKI